MPEHVHRWHPWNDVAREHLRCRLAQSGHAADGCICRSGWTRVIVEKPFGKDLESNRQLDRDLKEHLSEEQIFRIDHYLGKELIENLTVLRFANLVFEPLWSRDFIRNVQVLTSPTAPPPPRPQPPLRARPQHLRSVDA